MTSKVALLAWLKAVPPRRWAELWQGEPLDLALLSAEQLQQAEALLQGWRLEGLSFVPLHSELYPPRLLQSPSPPPFRVRWGHLQTQRPVAVIGTRGCCGGGRRRACRLARELAERGIGVVSGLALGIDRAAHEGALSVPGGRTLAVVGTGLDTVYPEENRELHDLIVTRGAVLSQFMPGFRGQRGGANFLARNRTMADLAEATVVVEASLRSGARSQAVYVQKRGGPLLLLRSLVDSQPWAAEMAELPGCFVVAEVADVLRHLSPVEG